MSADRPGESEPVSEDRAGEVFRRAARLQAIAAQRLEERLKAASSGITPAPRELGPDELESIGREVGIDPFYVRMALAERAAAPSGGFVRWGARWLLRAPADSLLLATRTVAAPPAVVLDAMRRLLPGEPHRLLLVDTVGDPLSGGALVFQVPAWAPGMPMLAYHASGVDARRLTFMLRELPAEDAGRASRTEIQVSGDLGPGLRLGVVVASILAGCVGTAGGLSAAVLSAAALGPLAAAAGAAGLAVGGLLGGRGYGVIYRYSARRFREEVDGLVGAVAADVATGGGFTVERSGGAGSIAANLWLGG